MSRERWVWRNGQMIEVGAAYEGPPPPRKFPMILRPMREYLSPVTGKPVNDRRQREADLKEHGCIPAQDLPSDERLAAQREKAIEESFERHIDEIARDIPGD